MMNLAARQRDLESGIYEMMRPDSGLRSVEEAHHHRGGQHRGCTERTQP